MSPSLETIHMTPAYTLCEALGPGSERVLEVTPTNPDMTRYALFDRGSWMHDTEVRQALRGRKSILSLRDGANFDSVGVGELVDLYCLAANTQGDLRFAGVPDEGARALLQQTNLCKVVRFHPTLDAAIDSYRTLRQDP